MLGAVGLAAALFLAAIALDLLTNGSVSGMFGRTGDGETTE